MNGLRNLAERGQRIEIRTVLHAQTLPRIICSLIQEVSLPADTARISAPVGLGNSSHDAMPGVQSSVKAAL